MVSPIPASSLRAAMMTLTPVVGFATCNGGCRSSTSDIVMNATIKPGRYATNPTMTRAANNPTTARSSCTQGNEIQAETATHNTANAIEIVNFAVTGR